MSPMPYRGEWKDIAPSNPRDNMRQMNTNVEEEKHEAIPNEISSTNQMVANFERNK
jgi:hypothetical protein